MDTPVVLLTAASILIQGCCYDPVTGDICTSEDWGCECPDWFSGCNLPDDDDDWSPPPPRPGTPISNGQDFPSDDGDGGAGDAGANGGADDDAGPDADAGSVGW